MKMPGKVKFAAITLIVLGGLWSITSVMLTLSSIIRSSKSSLISILPLMILMASFLTAGIGMLFKKTWAWWIAQISCLMISIGLINFLIIFKEPGMFVGIPILLIIPIMSILLFNKDSMLFFDFDENKRPKTIIKILSVTVLILVAILIKNLMFK